MLLRLCQQVISGLAREPKALAHTLLAKGVISQEKVEEIEQIPATDRQLARKMYDALLVRVEQFPHSYFAFISALSENQILYTDLLEALEISSVEIEKDQLLTTPTAGGPETPTPEALLINSE